MFLTLIGIGILALAITTAYLTRAIVLTKKTTVTVIDRLGAKPVLVLMPGWNFISWPLNTVHDVIPTDEETYNVPPFEMTCQIDNGDVKIETPNRTYGLGAIKSHEISFGFRIDFDQANGERTRKQLEKYYSLVKVDAQGNRDHKRLVDERIRDLIQSLFREEVAKLHLYDAINVPKETVEKIRVAVRSRCQDEFFPIIVTDLSINAPFEPASSAMQGAITSRAEESLKMEAAMVVAEAERRLAEIGIRTAEAKAKAMQVSAEILAKTWGIDQLPPAEKVATFMNIEALKTFRDLGASPSTKILLSTNLLAEINSGIGRFLSQGGKS